MVHFEKILIYFFIVISTFNGRCQITFNKYDNVEYSIVKEVNKNKPSIFFIEGSLPSPSYVKDTNNTIYYIGPKEIVELSYDYNLFILGKPDIPICVEINELSKDYIFRDSTGKIPDFFIQNDNLEYYAKAYGKIISYIKREYKLNKNIIVFGHSQGARIAIELALNNKSIKKLIFASSDPLGRVATIIDKDYANGEKEDKVSYLQSIIKDGSNSKDSTFLKSTYYSWRSFSYPIFGKIENLKKPILILYGDKDINCPNCYIYDYINIYYPNVEKYTFKGADHNFYDEEGNSHWKEVIEIINHWEVK